MNKDIYEFTKFLSSTGRSRETIRGYLKDAEHFVDWLGRKCGGRYAITPAEVNAYVSLISVRLAGSSVNRRCAALGAFYVFLRGRGQVSELPSFLGIRPRVIRPKIQCLSEKQVTQLIDSLTVGRHYLRRIRLVVKLIIATGLRLSEVYQLKRDDLMGTTLEVKSKDDRPPRILDIPQDIIDDWNNYVRSLSELEDQHLFISRLGAQLHSRSIRKDIRLAGERAGLEIRLSPSVLRHTYARRLIESGASWPYLKQLMDFSHDTSINCYRKLCLS